MKLEAFVPFFGVEVLVQFKETVVIAKPGVGSKSLAPRFGCFHKQGLTLHDPGKPPTDTWTQYVSTMDREGKPTEDPKAFALTETWPIVADKSDEGFRFTFFIEGARLFPHGDRIMVTYTNDGAIIELLVDPDLILACSTIRGREERASPMIALA